MGVVVRRYIDILTIIINFPYSTCISSFWQQHPYILLCSFLKCVFGLVYIQLKPLITKRPWQAKSCVVSEICYKRNLLFSASKYTK